MTATIRAEPGFAGAATLESTRSTSTPVDPAPLIGLGWIWRLRRGAILGQVAALALARFGLGIELGWRGIVPALVVLALSNVALGRWLARGQASLRLIAGVLLFDVAQLTTLLAWSGGAANPFSAFYVVHVAIAALMLGPLWAMVLVVLTSLCFGALFFVQGHDHALHGLHGLHTASFLHLQGMWVAYMLSASFVAYFVSRVAAALRERERQMEHLQRQVAGMQRVAALSTMAAGAAHELGSPLASIAVSAGELAGALSQHEAWAAFADEARQIREEVSRCRGILDRLAIGSGQPAGEAPELLRSTQLVERLKAELGPAHAQAFEVEDALGARHVHCPPRALVHALMNLIKNGIDANRSAGTDRRVCLRLAAESERATFSIHDEGAGISLEVQARLGEPFFTTKPNGAGMGLGIYLVQSFARQVDGTLRFDSKPGSGTVVKLTLGEGSARVASP